MSFSDVRDILDDIFWVPPLLLSSSRSLIFPPVIHSSISPTSRITLLSKFSTYFTYYIINFTFVMRLRCVVAHSMVPFQWTITSTTLVLWITSRLQRGEHFQNSDLSWHWNNMQFQLWLKNKKEEKKTSFCPCKVTAWFSLSLGSKGVNSGAWFLLRQKGLP